MGSLYNLKSAYDNQFRITKFDSDMNVESTYLVSDEACECPQFVNRDKRCRHMKMLKHFFKGPTIRLDTHWLYDFDRDAWFSQNLEASAEAHDGPSEVEATPTPVIDPISQPIPTDPLANFKRRV